MTLKKVEIVSLALLFLSVEMTIYVILSVTISNYDLLKYPFGLVQELPFSYWIAEGLTVISSIFTISQYRNIGSKLYSHLIGIEYLLVLFNSFFVFYFINPVFILSRDELGHATQVFILLTAHNTVANKGIYEADYPAGYIFGAFSYIVSGMGPTSFFLYYGPMFFTLFQYIVDYVFIRLFLKPPLSELAGIIYVFSSMPFAPAEWSPQLMSYNLLYPLILIVGLIVKRGGLRYIPLVIAFTVLSSLTDIATFTSTLVLTIPLLWFLKGKYNVTKLVTGYSLFAGLGSYIYWSYLNPAASGTISGDVTLIRSFVNLLVSTFLPQRATVLSVPAANLVSTFLPPSPFHFISVASKLLEGGIFLIGTLISVIFLKLTKKGTREITTLVYLGTTLLLFQAVVGLVDNVSNVLTRMIPQAMIFYVIVLVYYFSVTRTLDRRFIAKLLFIGLIFNVPLSILGYATISTSEHSPEGAFYSGIILGKYGISTISTYSFYKQIYIYEGDNSQSLYITSNNVQFIGPYVETLSEYFNGPNLKGYHEYCGGIVANSTIFFSSGVVSVSFS
ncbi:hypothetical protein HS7_15230 [Sulfolobales archaeon HS-7]|nr:hypothetical protein HS7_15230 [Sulfolobales archaeon HS-7]